MIPLGSQCMIFVFLLLLPGITASDVWAGSQGQPRAEVQAEPMADAKAQAPAEVWVQSQDQARTQAGFRLQSSTIGAAGGPGATGSFKSNGTMAQPAPIGKGTTATKTLYAGFWSKPWVLTSVLNETREGRFVDRLHQNFPNPFVASTTIAFSVASERHVDVEIYNILGQKVATLAGGTFTPGRHLLQWDATDTRGHRVSPGVYFYRLQAGPYESVKKLLVLK
jgi:hypothetical protein